jgi:hypothetical protein
VTYIVGSVESAASLHDPKRKYPRPHEIIKSHALEFLQLMFSSEENVGPELVWNIEQEQSCITIVDKYVFNLDQVSSRPAIVANRGPQGWMRTSGFRQFQGENMRTGERTYTDLVRGTVTLSCFAREGLEAERIAGIVFEAFQTFRDVLRKLHQRGRLMPQHLGFFRVESSQMGEEALVKSDSRPDLSVVPVAVAATVQKRWSLRPNARKLREVQVNVNASGGE